MIVERNETEAILGIPNLELAIVSAGRNELAIAAVRDTVHVIKMALLLENKGLGAPFPHQQLTQVVTRKRNPIAATVHGARSNGASADRQRMQQCEIRHLVQGKHAVALSNHQQIAHGTLEKRGAINHAVWFAFDVEIVFAVGSVRGIHEQRIFRLVSLVQLAFGAGNPLIDVARFGECVEFGISAKESGNDSSLMTAECL
mmetsp:Transcript_35351/g.57860  ORF Transcript_35351/g.57860 Transcript_35351/m.57860 type:complete len:201 (+) Transcript_35351:118-720(+)